MLYKDTVKQRFTFGTIFSEICAESKRQCLSESEYSTRISLSTYLRNAKLGILGCVIKIMLKHNCELFDRSRLNIF